jgi:hypothetical protein
MKLSYAKLYIIARTFRKDLQFRHYFAPPPTAALLPGYWGCFFLEVR